MFVFRSKAKNTRARRRVYGVGFVSVCMVACLASGMGLAVGLEHAATPPSLASASDAGSLALGSEEFDDARSLNVDVTASPASGVAFPVSGRVTFMSCPADGMVRSGSHEYDVDGTPLVSLHTATPLYRDLAYGDKGDDVAALQDELADLGYGGSRSGVFDWATWDAWRRLYSANAGTVAAAARIQQGVFSRALAVWLPAGAMTVSCAAALGSTVTQDSSDSPAFRSLAGVASVKAASLPDGRIQGERVVEIDGKDYPIGDDGVISDATALRAMAGWATYTGARKDGEDVTNVTVTYKLKTPIGVYSVPASALTGLKGSDGCVVSTDGTSVKAHVAGSSLGRTLVTIDGKAPSHIKADPGQAACDAR
ncbi:peptidoglycan-binding protein [Bifidobacterium amazonense]|uniref:Peptidoglycan-binding protein n=1 Tax=Bifidobacterium amazonense TaxID=2809027 RepID=A0ABS9VX83_9BIFI|nr:peptidoglycan-binding domain-containing protein [Bifidobacterium amazonense]MCH9276715.1 peptidoglycan-binding protein [Bifidobacterium amazonense]